MKVAENERLKGAGSLANMMANGVFITAFVSPIVGTLLGIIQITGQRLLALVLVMTAGLVLFAGPSSLAQHLRSAEHTSELQSLMRISYAVFCLKKKNKH